MSAFNSCDIIWCMFHKERVYLKLIHSLQLLKIWNQSGPIFQGLEKLNLELYHFWQVPKQYIQLEEESKDKLNSLYYSVTFVFSASNSTPLLHVEHGNAKNMIQPNIISLLQVHETHLCFLSVSPLPHHPLLLSSYMATLHMVM